MDSFAFLIKLLTKPIISSSVNAVPRFSISAFLILESMKRTTSSLSAFPALKLSSISCLIFSASILGITPPSLSDRHFTRFFLFVELTFLRRGDVKFVIAELLHHSRPQNFTIKPTQRLINVFAHSHIYTDHNKSKHLLI